MPRATDCGRPDGSTPDFPFHNGITSAARDTVSATLAPLPPSQAFTASGEKTTFNVAM